VRKGKGDKQTPAVVRYTRIGGVTKDEKLTELRRITSFDSLAWIAVKDGWQGAFRPRTKSQFNKWADIRRLMPWQHSGVQFKRLWPIGPSAELLSRRWEELVKSDNKEELFRESRDRKVGRSYPGLREGEGKLEPIEKARSESMLEPTRYAYRSFDKQWILPDNRAGDYLRPVLWQAHSERQVYLTSLFSIPLDKGPAAVACAEIPDLDSFRGSYGAKAVLPLYRDREGTEPNILPGLLELLGETYGKEVLAEEFAGYIYAVLGHPGYTERFAKELVNRQVRAPLTKDEGLFFQAAAFGQRLIWLHTYGERMTTRDRPKGRIPKGEAKCLKAVGNGEGSYPEDFKYDAATEMLHVGNGTFGPVSAKVFGFEVSGLEVVKSWLGYRMKRRSGRRSSPLDDIRPTVWTHAFTRELLELLWVLEHTVAGYPEQAAMFERILESELFTEDELPNVPEEARKPPKAANIENEENPLFD